MKTILIVVILILIPTHVFSDGSMRIEVEVYNGPLSKSLEVQKAELIGTVNLTSHVLKNIARGIHISECRLGCFGRRVPFDKRHSDWPTADQCLPSHESTSELLSLQPEIYPDNVKQLLRNIFPVKYHNNVDLLTLKEGGNPLKFSFFEANDYASISTKNEDAAHQVCPQLFDVKANIISVLEYIYDPNTEGADKSNSENSFILKCRAALLSEQTSKSGQLGKTQECLTKIAMVGKLLTEGAEHWANTQVAILSNSKRARISIARAAVSAAELGNEILARTDAIVRQQKGESVADLMPTSMYLRESKGTDYLNLFEWLDATPRQDKHWPTQSRTRMIERLISDNNWSKVNTAFARGDGKVSMVFVKDDIGNWNLKNYDNDPSEMLQAYKAIGTNLLTSAAKLATKTTTIGAVTDNIAGIKKTTQQAQSLLHGTDDASITTDVSTDMENRARDRILSTYALYKNKISSAQLKEAQANENIKAAKAALAKESKNQQDYEEAMANYTSRVSVLNSELAKAQQDFDGVNTNIDFSSVEPPSTADLTEYAQKNQNLIKKQAELANAKSVKSDFEKDKADDVEKWQTLLADIAKYEGELVDIKVQIADIPNQAVLVIEEIMSSYESNLQALKRGITASS